MTVDDVFALMHETDRFVDVHSFAAQERLRVHEARTAADECSGVIRDRDYRDRKCRTIYRNLQVVRSSNGPVIGGGRA